MTYVPIAVAASDRTRGDLVRRGKDHLSMTVAIRRGAGALSANHLALTSEVSTAQ